MSEATNVQVDMRGAIRKSAMTKKLPRAHKFVCNQWGADTVKILKMNARAMTKSVSRFHRKTGQLARSIGYLADVGEESWKVFVGTGLPGFLRARHARIQDEGGITHPRVTKRLRRWAWWMFGETGEEKYRSIALTKKKRLDVKVPATAWFSGVLKYRERDLSEQMKPEHVMKVAQGMAGV